MRYLLQATKVYNVAVPIEEIDRQYRTYTVSGPAASVVFDSRDDPLEPRRGLFLGGDAQLSLEALGGESYLRGFFQAASVRRLRADLVLVAPGGSGSPAASAAARALLPLPERFFAGGDFGPRGFPFDAVGPQVAGPERRALPDRRATRCVLGGAELRYNVTRAFQLASFLDLGNVYLRGAATSTSARCAAAPGSACATARRSGPCASTGATSSTRSRGSARSRFHLTIGHAF